MSEGYIDQRPLVWTIKDLCAIALRQIGVQENEWDTETDGASAWGSDAYYLSIPVMQEVQALFLWPELQAHAECALETTDSVFGSAYTLPEDCLRVLRVVGAETEYFYTEIGKQLWVQPSPLGDTIDVVYQKFSSTPRTWSPLLVQATVKLLSARLLGATAHDLAGAAGLEQKFFSEYIPSIQGQVEASAQVRGANTGASLDAVCESALRSLGVPQVSDWRGDAGVLARAIRGCLFPVIKEVQSLTRWPELIVSTNLQWTGGSDSRGYCFYAPERCLRILKAGNSKEWNIEGRYVYVRNIDPEQVQECRYVRYSSNPAEWSSELYALVVKLLAARIAPSGLGDPAKGRQLENAFWSQDRPRAITQVLNRSRRMSKQLNYEF